jgi:hypothetical protein
MTLFKQNVPIPVGGVSQMPPDLRGPGYADDLVNASVTVKGLGVRKGTQLLANAGAVDPGNTHVAEIAPAEDERYLVVLDRSGVRVVDAINGGTRPVSYGASPASFLSTGDFTSVGLGGELFVASRGYSKAQLTGPFSPEPKDGALITVETGQPSALYSITLDGITISYRSPDDPPPRVQRPVVGLAINSYSGPTPTNAFGMALSPTSAYYARNALGTHTIALNRDDGYLGPVNLSAELYDGTGDGLTLTFGHTTLDSSTTNNTTLSVSVAADAPYGRTVYQIRAEGDGKLEVAYLTIHVDQAGDDGTTNPVTPSGSFTVTTGNQAVFAAQNETVPVVFSIARQNGYNSAINLASANVPMGLGVSINPTYINNPTAHFTVNVTPAGYLDPGTYTFSLIFTGSGVAPIIRTVTVTVDDDELDFRWSRENTNEITLVGDTTVAHGLTLEWLYAVYRTATLSVDVGEQNLWWAMFSNASVSWPNTGTTLMVEFASNAPAGIYTIPYRASSPGSPDAFGTLIIDYTPSPGGGQ